MVRKLNERTDESLRDRLIDAAEALYAQHGFSEVSFRQICVAAGKGNNFSVQYYSGDIEQLASAIVAKRSMQFEVHRGYRLARVGAAPLDVRSVLEILNGPIVDLKDAGGEPLGAKFMVALQNTSWGWKPLSDQLEASPVTRQLILALEDMLPHIPPPVLWQRLYLTSLMIMNCAAQIPRDAVEITRDAVLANAFAMGAAAIEAPIEPAVAAELMRMQAEAASVH